MAAPPAQHARQHTPRLPMHAANTLASARRAVHTPNHPRHPGIMGEKLLEQVFNLKFMAKQLNRSAIKCEKDEKAERLKVGWVGWPGRAKGGVCL